MSRYFIEIINMSPIFWFTGMSGSGKSTLANSLKSSLNSFGKSVLIIDGDDVRNRLHKNLGFTPSDIRENNKLIIGLCEQYRQDYDALLVPIISPYSDVRCAARKQLSPGFHEIYVTAPLSTLRLRDTKGLYAAQERREIDDLIGVAVSRPYEIPTAPDLVINTAIETLSSSTARLFAYVSRCI